MRCLTLTGLIPECVSATPDFYNWRRAAILCKLHINRCCFIMVMQIAGDLGPVQYKMYSRYDCQWSMTAYYVVVVLTWRLEGNSPFWGCECYFCMDVWIARDSMAAFPQFERAGQPAIAL
jgi:hypothetical protein